MIRHQVRPGACSPLDINAIHQSLKPIFLPQIYFSAYASDCSTVSATHEVFNFHIRMFA